MTLQTDNPVIITELQTGSSASGKSDEFIELFNASGAAVDIGGWQLRYVNASNETSSSLIATLPAVELTPGGYFVVHTPSMALPATVPGQRYDAKLSNADKAIVLLKPDQQTCLFGVQDTAAWGASTKAEGGTALPVPASDKNAERHWQRLRDTHGYYVDTNTSSLDAKLSAATPTLATVGLPNTAISTAASPPAAFGSVPTMGEVPVPDCELPDIPDESVPAQPPLTVPPVTEPPAVTQPPTEELPPPTAAKPHYPAGNIGLMAPQLTEVLPNPAAPQTDAADEFIELYNPNAATFELTGFWLEAGKKRYVFADGTMLPPGAFRAYFSADTRLSLSNSGGQVRLIDPFGNAIASTDVYGAAKDGQAWARTGGSWAWTTTPTPQAANVVTVPAAKKKAASQGSAKSSASVASAAKSTAAAKTGSSEAVQGTSVASIIPDTPVHGSVLALVGGFALLYGLYEYRHDLANLIYRLRHYRATRRTHGCSAPGRRSDRTGE